MRKRIPLLTLTAVAALALSGAAQDGPGTVVHGKVTKIALPENANNGGVRATVTVEYRYTVVANVYKPHDKKVALVAVTDQTKVERQVGTRREKATLEEARSSKQGVLVKFTGPLRQADPARGTAA